MRIALLSYRSKAHVGGQGVYVHYLSHGLAEAGHEVTVFSAQPYPVGLDPRVKLVKVPSLDLYREPDPFRRPKFKEFRDWVDVFEYVTMLTGYFVEPLTFSIRMAKIWVKHRKDFDVVHDNQSLGYGLLKIANSGTPFVATIHHPISRDKALELNEAKGLRRLSIRRWYGFIKMQSRVARKLPFIIGVSDEAAKDTEVDFKLQRNSVKVIPLGVDTELFIPRGQRVPGRLVAIASADSPLKGVRFLLEALAKLRTQHDVQLHLVSSLNPKGETSRLIGDLNLRDHVFIHSGVSDEELAKLLASGEVMCVPSLYEGFSLPTVEAMACGTPVVASRVGALPDVVGADGECAVLVEPGNVEELVAAISALLASPAVRSRMSEAGRKRAEEHFSWNSVARITADVYQKAIDRSHLANR